MRLAIIALVCADFAIHEHGASYMYRDSASMMKRRDTGVKQRARLYVRRIAYEFAIYSSRILSFSYIESSLNIIKCDREIYILQYESLNSLLIPIKYMFLIIF